MRNVSRHLRVAPTDVERAVDALRSAGYEVRVPADWKEPDGRQYIEVVNNFVVDDSGTEDLELASVLVAIVRQSGATTVEDAGGGVVVQGGTPYHAWLRVVVDGQVTDMKILAADDSDIRKQLAPLADYFGVDASQLDAERPTPWPKV